MIRAKAEARMDEVLMVRCGRKRAFSQQASAEEVNKPSIERRPALR
jgi:hypothetical protein